MAASPAVTAAASRTRFLFRLHRWTGLLLGIPALIILASGTVAVFKDEIDELINPGLLVVEPGPSRVPLDQLFRTAQEGRRPLSRIQLPAHPARPLSVFGPDASGSTREVTLNPFTGLVLGERPANGHLADVLRQLHIRFYFFGATGRIVVGVFGLVLLISGLTGIILYPRFQRGWSPQPRNWRRGPQWLQSDLHKVGGYVSLAVNLLWAFTGAVLGLENLAPLHPPTQRLLHPIPSVRAEAADLGVSLDQVVASSRQVIDGFEPRTILLPGGRQNLLMLVGNTGGAWTAPYSSWIAFDPAGGHVLEVHDERQAHPVTKIYNLHDPLHFGYFAGFASKLIWFLVGIVVTALPVTGYLLWKHKRASRTG
ncbi:MAG: PepSY domain-containing protein [Bryobacterales bacterium]|nr:PepSY domain-containing protein [Bryobacterales bacterium]